MRVSLKYRDVYNRSKMFEYFQYIDLPRNDPLLETASLRITTKPDFMTKFWTKVSI